MADLLMDDAGRWLPAPLVMVGVRELVGDLRVWGVWLHVDYTVTGPWREGHEVSRRIKVSPRRGVFASIEGDLIVRPEGEDLTMVRFTGERASPASGLEWMVGRLTARSVVTRFLDEALSRLDDSVSGASDADPTGRTDDRPDA